MLYASVEAKGQLGVAQDALLFGEELRQGIEHLTPRFHLIDGIRLGNLA